jgi:hypothetical protein
LLPLTIILQDTSTAQLSQSQQAPPVQPIGQLSSITINHDWYIDSNEQIVRNNQTITVNGNIIINSSGTLELNNVTLILNNTDTRISNIIVQSSGNFLVFDSTIKPGNNNLDTSILLKHDSVGRFGNVLIDGLIQNNISFENSTSLNASIVCRTNNLVIINSIIVNYNQAIYIENCSPHLEDLTIQNCAIGITAKNSQMKLINCSIYTTNSGKTGLIISNNSIITSMNSNLGDLDLDAGSLLFLNRSLVIQVGFKTPYKLMIENADVSILTNNEAIYCTSGFNGSDQKTDENGSIKPITVIQSLYNGNELINYTTKVSVKYKTRSELNRTIKFNGTGSVLEGFNFYNHLPLISSPKVSPWSGNTETEYNYSILYSDIDNDKPAKVQVVIDGSTVNMTIVNSSINSNDTAIWKSGVQFSYVTKLNVGDHKFKFITDEGFGFSDVVVPNGPINNLDGPTVEITNHDPVLKYGSITPSLGNPNTVFKYMIKYRDIEGDKPSIAKVYIDNIAHQMIPTQSESASLISGNGLWYEFISKLPVGEHEFYFKFKDINNSNVVFWPSNNDGDDLNSATGPKVLPFENRKPVLGNGTVSPNMGYRYTLYSYTISYYDHEGDVPTSAVVFIDGESYNLSRARIAQDIYFYETLMPMGQHYYHFEFRDDQNDQLVRYPEEVGTEILGPVVIDVPPKLWLGSATPSIGTPGSDFIFNIYYEDVENDPPIESQVIIDNKSYDLEIISISETEPGLEKVQVDSNDQIENSEQSSQSGQEPIIKLLQFSTKLGVGTHSFYFQIKSQDFILRYPKSGFLTGPVVLEKDLDATGQNEEEDDSNNNTQTENKDNKSKKDENPDNRSDVKEKSKITKSPDLSASELNITILNYSAETIDGFPDYVYNFTVICKIPNHQDTEIQCWLYIDDEPFLMSISIQKNKEDKVIVFNLILELSTGDHFYHFIVSSNQSNGRVPYKGEFIISIIKDTPIKDDNTGLLIFDDVMDKQRADIIKILIIVLLAIAILYFSFYRKYLELKGKKNEFED